VNWDYSTQQTDVQRGVAMRLLIVGGTGRTGQKVIEQALERGHNVTALVRRPLLTQAEGLHIVVADPCNVEELIPALAEQDAVISCLGQRSSGNPWLVRDAAQAMVAAMQRTGARRYLIVSGALLFPSLNPFVLLLKRIMAVKLADARAMENAVSSANLDWTIVRPPHLQEGDRSKGYRIETGARPDLTWGLQFRDLAGCLLDLAEGQGYLRQVIGVASA
jgi:putative NADH-flavin reductase